MWFYFLTPEGLEKIDKASPGGAGRNRTLGLKALGRIEVPVPALHHQISFVEQLRRVQEIDIIRSEQIAQTESLEKAIIQSVFAKQM